MSAIFWQRAEEDLEPAKDYHCKVLYTVTQIPADVVHDINRGFNMKEEGDRITCNCRCEESPCPPLIVFVEHTMKHCNRISTAVNKPPPPCIAAGFSAWHSTSPKYSYMGGGRRGELMTTFSFCSSKSLLPCFNWGGGGCSHLYKFTGTVQRTYVVAA